MIFKTYQQMCTRG